MKKVCMVGLGYIGLPTAIVLADAGYDVHGFDIDGSRIARLMRGDPVIQEPDITEKLEAVLESQKFKPTTHMEPADYFVVAVPTPFKEEKKADLSYVFDAVTTISKFLSMGNVVILESTIPVGTTQAVADLLQERTGLAAGKDFFIAHCPERVLPGNIFYELVHNARIIGGINRASVDEAKVLYKSFVKADLYLTDAATAEMVKLVENSSRDVSIAFAHQVASMAYVAGLDPYEVIELANKHPRVNILNPSCGVGGHCIAVDPWFLVETFPNETQLLKAARKVNDQKPYEIMNFIKQAIDRWNERHQRPCTILLMGATYKADVDDLRESPALHIAQEMKQWKSINLLVTEPHVSEEMLKNLFGSHAVTIAQGIEQADIVVYLVKHKRFKAIESSLFIGKEILDFCGMLHEPKQTIDGQEHLFWPAKNDKSPNQYVTQVIDLVSSIKECA